MPTRNSLAELLEVMDQLHPSTPGGIAVRDEILRRLAAGETLPKPPPLAAIIRTMSRRDPDAPLTQNDLDRRRLKSCVDAWPYCYSGDYNPACCRFPKSCSPHGYIEAVEAGNLTDADLEPSP